MDLSILEKVKINRMRVACEYNGVKRNLVAYSLEDALKKIEKWVESHEKKEAKWEENKETLIEDADAVEEIRSKMVWTHSIIKIDRREDNKISVDAYNRYVMPDRALFRLLAYGETHPATLSLRAEKLYKKVKARRDKRAQEVKEVTDVVHAVTKRLGGKHQTRSGYESWEIPLGEDNSYSHPRQIKFSIKLHHEELLMEGHCWPSNTIKSWSGAKPMLTLERMGEHPKIAAVLADPTLMEKNNGRPSRQSNQGSESSPRNRP